MEKQNVEKLPVWKMIMYSLGSMGWALGSFAITNLLIYFYMPPETGDAPVFPAHIFQGSILGILTIIGIIFAGGRLFDAVTDPIIATWSDRSKSKFGRRRKFMLISTIPFALFSVLCFVPITQEVSILNSLWLAVATVFAFLFMTMYVTPHFAWMSELGHDKEERLLLSTINSIFWVLGYVIGSMSVAFQAEFEKSMSSTHAFQTILIIFAGISVLLMLLPVIFIDERRYCKPEVSSQGTLEALKSCARNKNFLYFVLSDVTCFAAQIFLFSGMVYYVTVLLEFDKEFYSLMMMITVAVSFLFYPLTVYVARRFGKKSILLLSFAVFGAGYLIMSLLGVIPLPEIVQIALIIILFAFGIAVSGILPNAVTADIAEADGIVGGEFKAGIFFGARTFAFKMGQMLAALIFPSFLLLGMSVENDLGIRLSAVAALFLSIAGYLLLTKYDEKEILNILANEEGVRNENR